jgi:hypothetical protein
MFELLTSYIRNRKRQRQFLDGLIRGFETQFPNHDPESGRLQEHKDIFCDLLKVGPTEWRNIEVFVRSVTSDVKVIDKLVAEGCGFGIKYHPITRSVSLIELPPAEGRPAYKAANLQSRHDDVMQAIGLRDFYQKGFVLGRAWSPFFFIRLGQNLAPWWLKIYWRIKDPGTQAISSKISGNN